MSKQKILFEAGPMLDKRKTGVGYFVNHLIDSLQDQYPDELQLKGYFFNFMNRRKNEFPENTRLSFYKVWFIPGKIISVCRRLGFQPWLELFVREKADTVIFTNYVSLPQLRKTRSVLVVYDLSFLDVPQYTQQVNLKYLRKFSSASIKKADVIITISEFTRSRLQYYFPNLKSKVVVTPIPPASGKVKKEPLTQRLEKLNIKNGKYILYVGTIEPRKNLENLVEAYKKMPSNLQADYSLVLAGGKGWKDESIISTVEESKTLGLNIIMTGYVSEQERKALYSNAACFTLPSQYEGFGMPVLEAMQYGLPCALSDIGVFREVADNAAVYFDKDDPADIAASLSNLLSDTSLKASLGKKGQLRLKAFSWKENAREVYQALK